MLKHDTSMDTITATVTPNVAAGPASVATPSIAQSFIKNGVRRMSPSMRVSDKSAAAFSFRRYFDEKMKTNVRIVSCNM